MKISLTFLCLLLIAPIVLADVQLYPAGYVGVSTVNYNGEKYNVITLKRKDNHIKAKYFAAPDNSRTVYQRYMEWSRGRNVILVSSGTYMDQIDPRVAKPVGLAIDNGVPVNYSLAEFDGLVIVYATGGIVVSNLKNADLTLVGEGISPTRKFDIRGSAWDRTEFGSWAKKEGATVFQTHLLVYKDVLQIGQWNSSDKVASRRFLAVGEDGSGNKVHVIVHYPTSCTLYQGASKVMTFLQEFKDMTITFMINLDTGAQNTFEFYNPNGTINSTIRGDLQLYQAVNLIAYYYE